MKYLRYTFVCLVLSMVALPAERLWSQTFGSAGSSITTTTYLDATSSPRTMISRVFDNGLGDIIQEQQIGVTANNKDIVTHHEYDQNRREVRVWNPTPTESNGNYVSISNLRSNARSYYDDNSPYTESVFDTFMPTWPESTFKPGDIRHTNDKKTAYSYRIVSDRQYIPSGNGSLTISGRRNLAYTVATDEDGHQVATSDNGVDRTILEERGDGKTAYIYDHRGNLCYVLPPLLYDYVSLVQTSSIYDSNDMMQLYAFIYRYDDHNRCIYKKLPGCEPIYYVYDKAGNCIFSQDGEQRTSNRWYFSIPDKFGRPCLTGTCTNTITYADTRYQNTCIYAQYTGATNARKGYDVSGIALSSLKLLSVNYYDDYSFIGTNSIPTSLNYVSEGIGQRDQNAHQGLLTGTAISCTRADGGVRFFFSAIYYDELRQPMQVRSTNLIGGINVETTAYTLTGEPERQLIRVTNGDTQASTILNAEYVNIYDFPHNNQLHHRVLKLKNATGALIRMDTIQSYTYNELGQIAQMKRGNHLADMTYDYDMLQGVLRSVSSNCGFQQTLLRENSTSHPLYNGSISAMQWIVPGEQVQRSYSYQYDNQNRLTRASYSELRNANAGGGGTVHPMAEPSLLSLVPGPSNPISSSNQYSVSYSYDKHSNILTLQRRGKTNTRSYDLVDDLTITYNGNQRKAVQDNATDLTYDDASDFVDGADTSDEYVYNDNGALKKDLNRGISSIQYDAMGNMQKISFSGNRSIEYYYTADGNKLRTIHRWPRTANSIAYYSDTTDYVCGLIMKNTHPVSFQFDGGYYSFDNDAYSGTHFYVQDYMGNVRAVINDGTGTVEQVTHYYPYGGVIGDISTNHSTQKFKFEGKELDRKFGLDWYDIHARQYDAIGVPSWNKVDKKAEDYYHLSPYVFAGGNPVNFGDYNGMDWISAEYDDDVFFCFDPDIKTVEDIGTKYYYGDQSTSHNIKLIGECGSFEKNGYSFYFHEDGSYSYSSGNNATIVVGEIDDDELGMHIGTISNNKRSANYFGNYLGDRNPKRVSIDGTELDSYCMPPIDELDYAAYRHDKGYDKQGARGISGVLLSNKTRDADIDLSISAGLDVYSINPTTDYLKKRQSWGMGAYFLFWIIGFSK